MKLRALNEGRKLKEIAADLLRIALQPSSTQRHLEAEPLAHAPKTMPVIQSTLPPSECPRLTDAEFCEVIKQAEMELDVKATGY
jgi:hypothetical protein